eukprot:5597623-Alexandrium_andersonii.AAC.1
MADSAVGASDPAAGRSRGGLGTLGGPDGCTPCCAERCGCGCSGALAGKAATDGGVGGCGCCGALVGACRSCAGAGCPAAGGSGGVRV